MIGASEGTSVKAQPAASVAPPAIKARPSGKVDLSNAASKGGDGAKLTLVEYSDFQCPFCRKFYIDTLRQVEKEYVETGKIRLMYKHFPLDSIHPGARPAAQAFECARDQGKEWQLHDKIFDEQNKLGQGTVDLSAEYIKKWASGIPGLDAAKLSTCLDSGEKNAIVEAHFQEGVSNGIGGTPGFLITDKEGNVLQQLVGAQPYSAFRQALDPLLS